MEEKKKILYLELSGEKIYHTYFIRRGLLSEDQANCLDMQKTYLVLIDEFEERMFITDKIIDFSYGNDLE